MSFAANFDSSDSISCTGIKPFLITSCDVITASLRISLKRSTTSLNRSVAFFVVSNVVFIDLFISSMNVTKSVPLFVVEKFFPSTLCRFANSLSVLKSFFTPIGIFMFWAFLI